MSDVAQPQRSASTSGACGLCSGRGGARRTLCATGTRQVKQIACSVAAGVAGQKKIWKICNTEIYTCSGGQRRGRRSSLYGRVCFDTPHHRRIDGKDVKFKNIR